MRKSAGDQQARKEKSDEKQWIGFRLHENVPKGEDLFCDQSEAQGSSKMRRLEKRRQAPTTGGDQRRNLTTRHELSKKEGTADVTR